MQSAGRRTRNRLSTAPSVADTASIVTLHTVADGAAGPSSRANRTTFARPTAAQSSASSVVLQRPEPTAASSRPGRSQAKPKRGTGSKAKADKLLIGSTFLPSKLVHDDSDSDRNVLEDVSEPDITPPKFTIDLSKPPKERYNHVAQHFTSQRIVLAKLFRQITKETLNWDSDKGRTWGRRAFRKLPSAEEDEEVQGIAHVWGVEKFILVAFNVLLDSFMGCTSGGVRVRDPPAGTDVAEAQTSGESWEPSSSRGRMLHLRTLDWGMEPLRKLVCEFEYIAVPGGDPIARQVTYFGFVGVLTGLRRGLSMSLNFRPCHDASSWWKKACFRMHQVLVLLGWRQSISSILRGYLLPQKYYPLRRLPTLIEIERGLPSKKTTAAYLIFSDGTRTTTFEKDHRTAVVRSASDFIVALNHDDDSRSAGVSNAFDLVDAGSGRERLAHDILNSTGMIGLVQESHNRKRCIAEHWKKARERRGGPTVQTEDVLEWMRDPEICNDETHYGVVMDPTKGEIVWLRRWLQPLEMGDPR